MIRHNGPDPAYRESNRPEPKHDSLHDTGALRAWHSGGPTPASDVQAPLPYATATLATVRCVAQFLALVGRGRLHLPTEHIGMRLTFADGTSAPVYRETTVFGRAPADPCILVVAFRLRAVQGRGHAVFRAESLLNTPLFAGYRGFVSKLWLTHDERGVYRGFYQWDGPERAEYYARSLWRVLAIVSVPGTIRYKVLPGLRRADILATPSLLAPIYPTDVNAWWRLVSTT